MEHVTFLGSKRREDLLGTGARANAYTDFHHTVFHVHAPVVNGVTGQPMLPQVRAWARAERAAGGGEGRRVQGRGAGGATARACWDAGVAVGLGQRPGQSGGADVS